MPRRRRRPRRQGRQLRRPARRRRPGRARPRLRRPGRRRAGLPRHHREQRRPRDHVRRGAPHGRAGVHPAHRRRGCAHGRRHRPRCCAPAPTRSGSTPPRIARPELLREAAERFGAQCVVLSVDARRCPEGVTTASGWEVTTHGGRRSTGHRRAGLGGARRRARARARSCSTRWTPTAPRTATTSPMIRAVRARVTVPVIASGGAGRLEDFAPAVDAGADAVLAASVFHFGDLTIGEVKRRCRRRPPRTLAGSALDALRGGLPGTPRTPRPGRRRPRDRP